MPKVSRCEKLQLQPQVSLSSTRPLDEIEVLGAIPRCCFKALNGTMCR
jgi:hypothetical protein